MSFDKIVEELANDYLKNGTYATKDEVIKVLQDTKDILIKNKDKTPEEIINIIISGVVNDLNKIVDEYGIPGIASQIKVDNINIFLKGGTSTKNSLFDVASITKLYTVIIAYKLINDGAFKLSDKIKDLDNRFENTSDLTVEEVLTFTSSFKSNGRIEDSSTIEEAKEKLFGIEVIQKGNEYNYNDMGLMMMKEVMENVTGKSFLELFDYYIKKPYDLNNTYLVVPKNKVNLVTGTPNIDGSVNDLKANVLRGFSGHAGIKVTSDDLVKLSSAINRDLELQNGLYEPNVKKEIRSSKFGNVYVNPKYFTKNDGSIVNGKELSYFGGLAPINSFATQGSTRVITRSSIFDDIDINSTILTSSASMSEEQIEQLIEKENIKRIERNKGEKLLKKEDIVKIRTYNDQTYQQNDIRSLIPESKTIEKIAFKYDNEIILKLLFLNKILKEYEKYDKNINVEQDIHSYNKK